MCKANMITSTILRGSKKVGIFHYFTSKYFNFICRKNPSNKKVLRPISFLSLKLHCTTQLPKEKLQMVVTLEIWPKGVYATFK